MKDVFTKKFWHDAYTGGKELAEALALIIVSSVAFYYTKHSTESIILQRVVFVAVGIVSLRAAVEFVRHLAHQNNNSGRQ